MRMILTALKRVHEIKIGCTIIFGWGSLRKRFSPLYSTSITFIRMVLSDSYFLCGKLKCPLVVDSPMDISTSIRFYSSILVILKCNPVLQIAWWFSKKKNQLISSWLIKYLVLSQARYRCFGTWCVERCFCVVIMGLRKRKWWADWGGLEANIGGEQGWRSNTSRLAQWRNSLLRLRE